MFPSSLSISSSSSSSSSISDDCSTCNAHDTKQSKASSSSVIVDKTEEKYPHHTTANAALGGNEAGMHWAGNAITTSSATLNQVNRRMSLQQQQHFTSNSSVNRRPSSSSAHPGNNSYNSNTNSHNANNGYHCVKPSMPLKFSGPTPDTASVVRTPWLRKWPFPTSDSRPGRHQHPSTPPPLWHSTVGLLEAFSSSFSGFAFDRLLNPRRALTKPSKPCHNNGHDNEKWDLIMHVNDRLGGAGGCTSDAPPSAGSARNYLVLDLLGHGTFGQVVKCLDGRTGCLVAVKVIKNQASYFNQSMMEVTVLEMLNGKHDRLDTHHIVRMLDTFVHHGHLCIVVELLSLNLYELIRQNQYRGFSLGLCRIFLGQCLDALQVLRQARIIHCDLKPENILLKSLDSPAVKIIDFGSACHEHQTVYTYIQSRFYRSPEVILGLPYSASIDMWSVGCIGAELFLGLPLFPGASNYDQMARIVEGLGMPPRHMIDFGKDSRTYFARKPPEQDVDDRQAFKQDSIHHAQQPHHPWVLKSRETFGREQGKPEPPSKRYFASTDLTEIVMSYPVRKTAPSSSCNANQAAGSTATKIARTPSMPSIREGMIAPLNYSGDRGEAGDDPVAKELAHRRCFLDFLRGCLRINPMERWSPAQAAQHPFITGKPFTGPFTPTAAAVSSHPAQQDRQTTTSTTTRPRSNTIAALSFNLDDVPAELQRLAAAVEQAGPINPSHPHSSATNNMYLLDSGNDSLLGSPKPPNSSSSARRSSYVAPTVQSVERAAAGGTHHPYEVGHDKKLSTARHSPRRHHHHHQVVVAFDSGSRELGSARRGSIPANMLYGTNQNVNNTFSQSMHTTNAAAMRRRSSLLSLSTSTQNIGADDDGGGSAEEAHCHSASLFERPVYYNADTISGHRHEKDLASSGSSANMLMQLPPHDQNCMIIGNEGFNDDDTSVSSNHSFLNSVHFIDVDGKGGDGSGLDPTAIMTGINSTGSTGAFDSMSVD